MSDYWDNLSAITLPLSELELELELELSRIKHELADHGAQITPYRVRALRKKLNLYCKQKRKFKVTTGSKHHLPFALNILKREFAVSAPDKACGSAILLIFLQKKAGCILPGIKDLFNGELVGYAMSERVTTDLVIQALFRATDRKFPEKSLILHSVVAANIAHMITSEY